MEAHGFKSFADRTEIEFDRGITAIVGPNGSGKSNISDAILWVLGEQSAKTLRGAKMEDIIFSGSAGRRPLGMAEVSLTFDNTDGMLPVEYNEVTFTRRVYRSGESEYYFNRRPCRLKEIQEILAPTGLGKDAMVVIGQNRVDEVLNSKPEERRLLFEDAAGISKYKQRKREAVRKLEETELNLTRVADIRGEIDARLEPMEESARKAKAYKELEARLRRQQVSVLCLRLDQAQEQQGRWQQQEEQLRLQNDAGRTALYAAESESARCQESCQMAEAAAAASAAATEHGRQQGEALQQQQAVLQERRLQEEARRHRLQQEQVEAAREEERACREGEGLSAAWTQQAETLQQARAELVRKEEALQRLQGELSVLERQVAGGREAELARLQELLQLRHDAAQLRQQQQRLEEELVQLAGEEAQQQRLLAQAQRQRALLTAAGEELAAQIQAQRRRGEEAQHQERRCREAGQLQREEIQKLRLQLREWTARRQLLQQMKEAREGFGRAIKALMKSKASWREGIAGPVAELIQVGPQYVTAVELALGGALQHIVVAREEVAKEAIAFLKTQRLGRATFLPLSALRPQAPREVERRAASMPGALGFASSRVQCSEEHRKAVEFLLGRTVLVETVEQAIAIARQTGHSVKLVTLDGEVLSPGGAMSGGSRERRESGLLGREQELASLAQQLAQGQVQAAAQEEKQQRAQAAEAACAQELQAVREELQALQLQYTAWEGQRQACEQEEARWRQTGEAVQKRRQEREQELSASRQRWQEVSAALSACEAADDVQRADVSQWQEQQALLSRRREEEQSRQVAAKVRQAALEEQRRHLEERLRTTGAALEQARCKRAQLAQEEEQLHKQEEASKAALAEVQRQRAECAGQQQQAETALEQAQAERVRQDGLRRQALEAQELCRRQAQETERQLHAVELHSAKASYEVETAVAQLEEQFSLTPVEAQELREDGTLAALGAAIARLEQDLAALGPVNLNAEEEYAQLLERHSFLEKQFEDLASSLEQLRQVIAEMDATMASQFHQAFRCLSEYFAGIFQALFGGGKAELRLTAPDNLLETGIEVFVQPPGKKTQHLALLSGGERALTVIALLFSFLRYRPAPFCVVDEIDAPLDEANLRRFSGFLREYAAHTQFLVVTHRKGTMEAADRLHGVTLHENGVSRVISVELEEKTAAS